MISQELGIIELPLKDAFAIKPKVFQDERGEFYKLYARSLFEKKKVGWCFPEQCITVSKKNVLRGLHYQEGEFSQAKIVQCIKGELYDVIVDLRKSSPTFGKWHGNLLSGKNMMSIYVPRGFAHGFLVLEEGTTILYSTDNDYEPKAERGIVWDDPTLKIKWPVSSPILSEKDRKWPLFADAGLFE